MSSRRLEISTRPTGFTITEMLVTIGILITLLSILVVTVSGVRQTARVATTRAIMTAMSQATSRFKADTGYLPPILDNDRGLVNAVPITDGVRTQDGYPKYLHDMQGWYSYTSPGEYLIGYGFESQDGAGALGEGSLGIRHPGSDGVWGATRDSSGNLLVCPPGALGNRQPDLTGPVLGPYLDLKADSTIASLGWDQGGSSWDTGSIDPTTGQPAVFFPGEPGYHREAPKVIVDAWGTPIRYYRRSYTPGDPSGSYPSNYQVFPGISQWRYTPQLSEFIALRPWDIDPNQATDYFFAPGGGGNGWGDFNQIGSGSGGDSSTTASLQSGEFAFLSAGPDRQIFNWHRTDYPDRGGNDGQTFKDWIGHFPDRGIEDNWYAAESVGGHCRAEPWFEVPVTDEANRDNIREVGP